MKRGIEVAAFLALCATFGLIVAVGLWFDREAPLIHSALWNFSSSSYDVKMNSARELTETNKILADAHDLFSHTDITLNGPKGHPGLIPQATLLVQKAQPAMDNLAAAFAHLNSVAEHLDRLVMTGTGTMQELTSTVAQFRVAIANVDKLTTDPKIHELFESLALTVADIDTSVKQLNVMLLSATATAQDVQAIADKIREQYMKARNLYYAIAKELLGIGSQGIQFWLKK